MKKEIMTWSFYTHTNAGFCQYKAIKYIRSPTRRLHIPEIESGWGYITDSIAMMVGQ